MVSVTGLQLAGDPPLSAPWHTSMELKGTPMHRQPVVALVEEVIGWDSFANSKTTLTEMPAS